MKMGRFEKRFVNSDVHSHRVAEQAQQLVATAKPKPGQQLLDVGCGNGAASIQLAKTLGLAVTGIDVDTEQIEAASAAANGPAAARFLAADATRLPFADGEFDLVYSNKTTHHVREWQRALTEMTRVLKPEGHLVYSDFVAPVGSRLPTRRALNRFAEQHGLQIVRRSGSLFHYMGVFRKVKADGGVGSIEHGGRPRVGSSRDPDVRCFGLRRSEFAQALPGTGPLRPCSVRGAPLQRG